MSCFFFGHSWGEWLYEHMGSHTMTRQCWKCYELEFQNDRDIPISEGGRKH